VDGNFPPNGARLMDFEKKYSPLCRTVEIGRNLPRQEIDLHGNPLEWRWVNELGMHNAVDARELVDALISGRMTPHVWVWRTGWKIVDTRQSGSGSHHCHSQRARLRPWPSISIRAWWSLQPSHNTRSALQRTFGTRARRCRNRCISGHSCVDGASDYGGCRERNVAHAATSGRRATATSYVLRNVLVRCSAGAGFGDVRIRQRGCSRPIDHRSTGSECRSEKAFAAALGSARARASARV